MCANWLADRCDAPLVTRGDTSHDCGMSKKITGKAALGAAAVGSAAIAAALLFASKRKDKDKLGKAPPPPATASGEPPETD